MLYRKLGHALNKLSAGRFEVDIYPRGALGKEMDLLQAARAGAAQAVMGACTATADPTACLRRLGGCGNFRACIMERQPT